MSYGHNDVPESDPERAMYWRGAYEECARQLRAEWDRHRQTKWELTERARRAERLLCDAALLLEEEGYKDTTWRERAESVLTSIDGHWSS